ncbi:hypothetical protein DFS34DRAFT_635342, partial [Phlyctochytrium arcticum]
MSNAVMQTQLLPQTPSHPPQEQESQAASTYSPPVAQQHFPHHQQSQASSSYPPPVSRQQQLSFYPHPSMLAPQSPIYDFYPQVGYPHLPSHAHQQLHLPRFSQPSYHQQPFSSFYAHPSVPHSPHTLPNQQYSGQHPTQSPSPHTTLPRRNYL